MCWKRGQYLECKQDLIHTLLSTGLTNDKYIILLHNDYKYPYFSKVKSRSQ